MRILFIGDIYSKPGMEYLEEKWDDLKTMYRPNIILANAENATHGRGMNQVTYKALMMMGVHACTMGNWVWTQRDLQTFIEEANIARPCNFKDAPGKPFLMFNYNGKRVLIINALGKTFMNPNVMCPFETVDAIINENPADYIIVDFHAEATSEKVAFGHYFDGRVSAVLGTHTHIQTNDARKLPGGTLYITDVGMTGPKDGVIGVEKEHAIFRFIHGYVLSSTEAAKGPRQINAVLCDLEKKTIETIQISE